MALWFLRWGAKTKLVGQRIFHFGFLALGVRKPGGCHWIGTQEER
jgi:hypothetical protein